MKTVYFVRHGESEVNLRNYTQGDHQSPLTAKGREQAVLIAERCAKLPVDIIISSTMRRAQETAQTISNRIGTQIESSDLFHERKSPTILDSNERYRSPLRQMRDAWLASFYSESGERVEDGENFSDIMTRAGEALAYLETRPENNILVVAHGFILRTVLSHVLFGKMISPEEFRKFILSVRVENTGISVLHFDPDGTETYDNMPIKGWFMRVWNDHAHLG